MDAVSYSHADKQKQRIEKVNANPDSTSGLVTMPSIIASGESITIPAGRTVVHPNLQVDGTLDIQGTLYVPAGGTISKVQGNFDAINLDGKPLSTGQRKNYLINGDFSSWEYATSQTSSGYGSDNRGYNLHSGSTKTHSRMVSTNTERELFSAENFSRTVVSSVAGAGNFVQKTQLIENVNKMAGKTVTLSLLAKADSTKNIAVEFTQCFGSGGSPSAQITGIGSQLIQLTNTWQWKGITVALPSLAGKALGTDGVHTSFTGLSFWFDAGSSFDTRTASLGQQSGTFDIAEIKIEDGSVATDGWHPYDGEFGGEVQARQRYYYKIHGPYRYDFGIAGATNEDWFAPFNHPVTMRVAPTFNGGTSDIPVTWTTTIGNLLLISGIVSGGHWVDLSNAEVSAELL